MTYTATGGQTSFAVTYDVGYVDVYLNGVKLVDTTDFTATSAEGGKFVCIWYPNQSKFRIGGISTKAEDSSITFSDSDDYGDLEDFSLGKVFAYPMYRVYLVDDKEGFEVTNFVDVNENASFAGPVRSGELNFIQRDVK